MLGDVLSVYNAVIISTKMSTLRCDMTMVCPFLYCHPVTKWRDLCRYTFRIFFMLYATSPHLYRTLKISEMEKHTSKMVCFFSPHNFSFVLYKASNN